MEKDNLIITREKDMILVTNQRGITLQLDNEELLNKTDDDIVSYCSRLTSFNAVRKRGDKRG